MRLVELLHGLIELIQIIREDPRIGVALAVLMIAGALVAFLIRRVRRDEFLTIRK
jgi:hypothetical protein